MWLAIILWVIGAALATGFGFVLLVAQAFTRRSRSESLFAKLILAPGLKWAQGNPLATYLLSWGTWAVLGSLVIAGIYRGRF